ncbi:MAG: DUF948 domain-containing protein [Ignavibacteria bacterium]|nr:DUF948 domain-containing protein [Ignavibacteria bacterium]
MQEVNLVSGITAIALYIALIALVIFLIIAIKRIVGAIDNINRAIDNIEKKVDHITSKAEPLIDNTFLISNDIKEISANLSIQSLKINGIVDSVKDTTDSIIDFEQKVQKEVETNVFDTLNMVTAVSRGIKTFIGVLSGSKNGSAGKKKIRSNSSLEEDLY